jgi:hypothetical protein
MECYDKILSAYEERWAKTMGAKEGQWLWVSDSRAYGRTTS